jgi:hypothetical protein
MPDDPQPRLTIAEVFNISANPSAFPKRPRQKRKPKSEAAKTGSRTVGWKPHKGASDDELLALAKALPAEHLRTADDETTNALVRGLEDIFPKWVVAIAYDTGEKRDNLWCLAQPGILHAVRKVDPAKFEHVGQLLKFLKLTFVGYVMRDSQEGEGGRQFKRVDPLEQQLGYELVQKWENEGRSPQWIEAELNSLGILPLKTLAKQPREIAEGGGKGTSWTEREILDYFRDDVRKQSRCSAADDEVGRPSHYADDGENIEVDAVMAADQAAAWFEGEPAEQEKIRQFVIAAAKHLREDGGIMKTAVARELGWATLNGNGDTQAAADNRGARQVEKLLELVSERRDFLLGKSPQARLRAFFGLPRVRTMTALTLYAEESREGAAELSRLIHRALDAQKLLPPPTLAT